METSTPSYAIIYAWTASTSYPGSFPEKSLGTRLKQHKEDLSFDNFALSYFHIFPRFTYFLWVIL